jgi:hypothetical protein
MHRLCELMHGLGQLMLVLGQLLLILPQLLVPCRKRTCRQSHQLLPDLGQLILGLGQLLLEQAVLLRQAPCQRGWKLEILLRELHRDGTTIVIITHDHDVAAAVERRIEIRDGRITRDTPTGT